MQLRRAIDRCYEGPNAIVVVRGSAAQTPAVEAALLDVERSARRESGFAVIGSSPHVETAVRGETAYDRHGVDVDERIPVGR